MKTEYFLNCISKTVLTTLKVNTALLKVNNIILDIFTDEEFITKKLLLFMMRRHSEFSIPN